MINVNIDRDTRKQILEYIRVFKVQKLEKLLQSGTNPDQMLTKDGDTAVHIAASEDDQFRSYTILKILLRYSANPNCLNRHGETSLHLAASLGHQISLNLLLSNGGDLLRTDIRGVTPVDVAYRNGFFAVADRLTEYLNLENISQDSTDEFTLFLWKRVVITATESSTKKTLSEASAKDYFTEGSVGLICPDLPSNEGSNKNTSGSRTWKELTTDEDVTLHISSSEDDALYFQRCLEQCISDFNSENYSDVNSCIMNIGFLRTFNADLFSTIIDLTSRDSFAGSRFACLPPNFPSQIASDFSGSQSSHFAYSNGERVVNTPFRSSSITEKSRDVSSSDSFVTAVEEFLYEDVNEKIQFIEKRCPGVADLPKNMSWSKSHKTSSVFSRKTSLSSRGTEQSTDSVPTLTSSVQGLNGDQLKEKLKNAGFVPGPVTPATFRVLQRHYLRLRNNPKREMKPESQREYSPELGVALRNVSIFDPEKKFEKLELGMIKPFNTYDKMVVWRDGEVKSCFTYLLLDPRITNNLPLRRCSTTDEELFRTFIASIFYVGKGSRNRPYYHLHDAALYNSCTVGKNREKIEKIKSIWSSGLGVISFHIFQNTIPVEAWTREASMIAAIGLKNLCNVVHGTLYGPASTWSKKEQRQLGTHLLVKAFRIFLFEGERQIRPRDVSLPKGFMKRDNQ